MFVEGVSACALLFVAAPPDRAHPCIAMHIIMPRGRNAGPYLYTERAESAI